MRRKWKVIAVPLVICGALLWMLAALNRKSDTMSGNGKGSGKAAGAAPSDRIHEIASLEEELRKKPAHPPILLRLADLAREEGKKDDAIKYLRQAVEADADNSEARIELGRSLFESGQPEEAIAVTRKILETRPKHVDALYNLGAIYGNLGQEALARQYFQQAMAAEPGSESGRKAKDALSRLGP